MVTLWAFLVVVVVREVIHINGSHINTSLCNEGAKSSMKLKIYVVAGICKHEDHVFVVKQEGIDDGLTVFNNSLRTVHVHE